MLLPVIGDRDIMGLAGLQIKWMSYFCHNFGLYSGHQKKKGGGYDEKDDE